jgi:RHS repeat-associated protein
VEHLETAIETTPFRFTGKEWDSETGLYYFGARYLNPQTSMWLSADPAMGEYIPQAPINDEAKQHNKELPEAANRRFAGEDHGARGSRSRTIVTQKRDLQHFTKNVLPLYNTKLWGKHTNSWSTRPTGSCGLST